MERDEIYDQESISLQEVKKLVKKQDQICQLVNQDYQRLVKQKTFELPAELLSIICQEMPVTTDKKDSKVQPNISNVDVAKPRVAESQLKQSMDQYINLEKWITKQFSKGSILLNLDSFLVKKQLRDLHLKRVLKETSRVLAIDSWMMKDCLEAKGKFPQDLHMMHKLKQVYDYEHEQMKIYYPGQEESLLKYLTSRQLINGQKDLQSESDKRDQDC